MRKLDPDFEKDLEDILEQRATRLGMSREEAGRLGEDSPRYLEGAKERAQKEGLELEELLEQDLRRMREARYPGPDCLEPSEVEQYADSGRLAADREEHVRGCPGCSRLLEAASPTHPRPEQARESILEWPRSFSSSAVRRLSSVLEFPRLFSDSEERDRSGSSSTVLAWAVSIIFVVGLIVVLGRPAEQGGLAPKLVGLLPPPAHDGASGPSGAWADVLCTEVLGAVLERDHKGGVVPWERFVDLGFELEATSLQDLNVADLTRVKRAFGTNSLVRCSTHGNDPEGESFPVLRLEVEEQGELRSKDFAVPWGTSEIAGSTFLQAGDWVKSQLGLEVGTAEDPQPILAASMPKDAEAAHLYALGLSQLQHYHPSQAVGWLRQSTRIEGHPRAYSVLAKAWSRLGYQSNERAATESALQVAGTYAIPEAQERALAARHLEAAAQWDEALEIYHALEDRRPLDPEYKILSMNVLLATSNAEAARQKLEELLDLDLPEATGGRVSLLQARVSEMLGDARMQREYSRRAVERARSLGARSLEAQALVFEANAARRLGDWDLAGSRLEAAGTLYDRIGDDNNRARVFREQGVLRHHAGDIEAAEQLLMRSLREFRAARNAGGEAMVEIDLGHLMADASPGSSEAMDLYDSALRRYRQLGDLRGAARARISKGALHIERGDWSSGEEELRTALLISRRISDRENELYALANLAKAALDQGKLRDATRHLTEVLEARKALGLRRGEGWAHTALAEALTYRGHFRDAERHLGEAKRIFEELGEPVSAMRTEISEASLLIPQGKPREAEERARAALRGLGGAAADGSLRAEALLRLGDSLLAQHKDTEARNVVAELEGEQLPKILSYEARILSARSQTRTGDPKAAAKALRAVIASAGEERFLLLELKGKIALADALRTLGDSEEAEAVLKSVRREAEEIGAELILQQADGSRSRDSLGGQVVLGFGAPCCRGNDGDTVLPRTWTLGGD